MATLVPLPSDNFWKIRGVWLSIIVHIVMGFEIVMQIDREWDTVETKIRTKNGNLSGFYMVSFVRMR